MSEEIWFQKTVNVHNNRGGDKLGRKVIPAGIKFAPEKGLNLIKAVFNGDLRRI